LYGKELTHLDYGAAIPIAPGIHHHKTPQLALQGFNIQSQTAGLIVMGSVRNILSTMRYVLARAGNGIAGGKKGEKGKAK
jgi:hypothetical protein